MSHLASDSTIDHFVSYEKDMIQQWYKNLKIQNLNTVVSI